MADLAQQFDVRPNQIQDWKKKLALEAEHAERETQQLHAKIGQLPMEKYFSSKTLGRDR